MAEVVNDNVSEPKRQKREENMEVDDESLSIIERLESLRKDISNCIDNWEALNIEEKMAKVDDVFNKVIDRVNNLVSKGLTGMKPLFRQAKDKELLEEKKKLKETIDLLCDAYWAFLNSHKETYLEEFDNVLLKLYMINKKTNKLSEQLPKLSIKLGIYDMFYSLGQIDDKEVADFNEADHDYDALMKEMIGMMDHFDKRGAVQNYWKQLISSVRRITENIDWFFVHRY